MLLRRWPAPARLAGLILPVLLLFASAAPAAASGTAVEMYHVLLTADRQGGLQVSERLIFGGLEGFQGILEIPLPAGAEDVRPGEGAPSGEVREGKIVFSGPFGTEGPNVVFSYRLRSTTPHYDLGRIFPWPVKTLLFLTPQADLVVSGTGIVPAGDFPMGGTDYKAFLAENLPAQQRVEVLVTVGTVSPGGGKAGAGFWEQLPLGRATPYLVLAVAAVIALALVFSRRGARGARARLAVEEEAFRRLRAEEQVLLRRLQELEEKYAAQQLDRDTYERLQEEYKSRLIRVRSDLRQLT